MKVVRYLFALVSLAAVLTGCGGDGIADTTRDGGYFGSGLRTEGQPADDGSDLGSGN